MNIEELRAFCLAKKMTEECFPFDDETLVLKVMGKMYVLASINSKPLELNLKCEPEKAIALREQYDCVLPGYHMHKKHWNTVICNNNVPVKLIKEWIIHSYDQVVSSLTKKQRAELENAE